MKQTFQKIITKFNLSISGDNKMKNLIILFAIVIGFVLLFEPINLIKNISGEETINLPLKEYHNDIVRYAIQVNSVKYNVPEGIMESIIYQESQWELNNPLYNAHVVGDSGRSFGAGQVQLPTAKAVWRDSNLVITDKKLKYDIEFNVETATKLIRKLYDILAPGYKTEKEIWLATLTCYNMGEGSFAKNKRRFNGYAFAVYNRYIDSQQCC